MISGGVVYQKKKEEVTTDYSNYSSKPEKSRENDDLDIDNI